MQLYKVYYTVIDRRGRHREAVHTYAHDGRALAAGFGRKRYEDIHVIPTAGWHPTAQRKDTV
jgi:hypothetical protein